MDVRCEKCHTEYELEESKVTEAGVTVKCTSCGNLFKIKRRGGAVTPASVATPEWIVKSPGQSRSEGLRVRDLTTLQQWIVERKVTRDMEISRTGDSWKRLGDIGELVAFFNVVDQAVAAQKTERKGTEPFAPAGAQAVRAPSKNIDLTSAPFDSD